MPGGERCDHVACAAGAVTGLVFNQTFTAGGGSHALLLEVSGGDGCVEIDMVTLRPADTSAGAQESSGVGS
jgi:hypothetical protein